MTQNIRIICLLVLSCTSLLLAAQDTLSRPSMTLKGHVEDIEVITYSPDGKLIASGGWDRTIRIWDAKTGAEVKNFRAHDASVSCLAYSRDSKYIISGSRDNSVKIWDSAWGLKYNLYGHQNIINTVVLDPKVRFAYSGSADGVVKLWDLKKKGESKNLKKFDKPVHAIALNITGTDVFVATQTPEIVKLDFKGEVKTTYNGHTDEVNSLSYALNNKYLLSGSSDKTAIIWDVLTGKAIRKLEGHNWKVTTVAFSLDSKYAVTGSTDGSVRLWDVETGKLIRIYLAGVTSVSTVAMSPDITQVASAGMVNSYEADSKKFLVYLWESGQELESAKLAKLKKFREDSIQYLKDSVKRYRDSAKAATDSLKKIEKLKKEEDKKKQTTPPANNKQTPPANKEGDKPKTIGAPLKDERNN